MTNRLLPNLPAMAPTHKVVSKPLEVDGPIHTPPGGTSKPSTETVTPRLSGDVCVSLGIQSPSENGNGT